MKRDLERVDIPGEHEARERAWSVVTAAFTERKPVPQPSYWPRVAAVAIAASAVVAATLSSPGRAVLDEIREVVGVERAQPALFSLPTSGRLLVTSDAGAWVVQKDGSKRLLGDYRETSWSPFGRFVIAARDDELAALEPDGDVRWTLARRGARAPAWAGSETDTRIAYLTTTVVRVVGGDGTGDVEAGGPSHRVAPAWRPGAGFTLTFVDNLGRVRLYDVDSGIGPWRPVGLSRPFRGPRELEWTSDGRRLLLRTNDRLVLFGSRSRKPLSVRDERLVDTAFRPGSYEIASLRTRGGVSELVVGNRSLFSGTGRFTNLVWSPDGRWVLLGWPAADQWVFVRADGRKIRAVSNISEQFRSRSFPRVEGWCCRP